MDSNQFIPLIRQLVSVESIAGKSENLGQVLAIAEKFLAKHVKVKFVARRFEHAGKPSIVFSNKATKQFDVLFAGHLDVIGADKMQFRLSQKNGRLYGRGVCDMKGEIAVLLHLFVDLLNERSSKAVGFMLTTDEEVGGSNGVGYLVQDIGYRAGVVILPDGGEHAEHIIHQNKGVIHATITAKGLSAHASRPWLGRNAIHEVLDAYARISRLFHSKTTRDGKNWVNTCSLGVISGGGSVNQVPDSASIKIDIRHIPSTRREVLLKKLKQVARPCALMVDTIGEPIYVDPHHKAIKLYQKVSSEINGRQTELDVSHGSNDGRYFSALGIPVIVSRPRSGGQHSSQEWIDIKALSQFYEINRQYITELLSR